MVEGERANMKSLKLIEAVSSVSDGAVVTTVFKHVDWMYQPVAVIPSNDLNRWYPLGDALGAISPIVIDAAVPDTIKASTGSFPLFRGNIYTDEMMDGSLQVTHLIANLNDTLKYLVVIVDIRPDGQKLFQQNR